MGRSNRWLKGTAVTLAVRTSELTGEDGEPMKGLFVTGGQAKEGDLLGEFVGKLVETEVYKEWLLNNRGEPKYGIRISEDVVLDCGGQFGHSGLVRYANNNATNNNANIRVDTKTMKARLYAKKVIRVGDEVFTAYGRGVRSAA